MSTVRRLVVLFSLLAGVARAQTVSGTVRDNASGQPVPGAVVFILDSARVALARTLTNARGEYTLTRSPDARTLRALRLGFRPAELAIPPSSAPTQHVDISIVAVPVTLEPVRTIAAAACPRRRDSQEALSLLDQVRSGLLATVVARTEEPATLTRLEYIRTRNFDMDNVMSMTVNMDSTTSNTSYTAALSAETFIQSGFAVDTAGMLNAYGPDAEVLIDEAFAGGYCFRLMDAEPSRPRQIGLGFAPAQTKRGRIDIDGALWVDTATKALVDIEFRYEGFPRLLDPAKPGGHIEFRTMPNGVPLIDRWFLRVPSQQKRAAVDGQTRRERMVGNLTTMETGGELAHARWKDGTTWNASLGAITLHLTDRRGRPDPARIVRLDSTSYVARSDSAGNIRFDDLVPGPYTMSLLDGRLLQIGVRIPVDQTFSAMRDSVFHLDLVTETAEEHVRELCAADRSGNDESQVIGRVLQDDGTPASEVSVAIDRLEDGAGPQRLADEGHTGSNGLFHWCGLKEGMHIAITVSRGSSHRTIDLRGIPLGLTVLQFKLNPP